MGRVLGKKKEDTKPDLPRNVQVGELCRVKEDRVKELEAACIAAGWDNVRWSAVRKVTREDRFMPGGGRRLFVDGGPPFCFSERDVVHAYKDDDGRREALRKLGWKV